jgi:hypothetical protein
VWVTRLEIYRCMTVKRLHICRTDEEFTQISIYVSCYWKQIQNEAVKSVSWGELQNCRVIPFDLSFRDVSANTWQFAVPKETVICISIFILVSLPHVICYVTYSKTTQCIISGFPAVERDFSSAQSVKIGSENHPACSCKTAQGSVYLHQAPKLRMFGVKHPLSRPSSQGGS